MAQPTAELQSMPTSDEPVSAGAVALRPSEVEGPAPAEQALARRARFRAALGELSARSSADDLIRWMLVPGSIFVFLGFGALILGWLGAARTAREIEQIPYLISGGLIGLALVVLGGLLLVSTFWVAVLRKLQSEAEARARSGSALSDELTALRSRVAELETAPAVPTRTPRAARTKTSGARSNGS